MASEMSERDEVTGYGEGDEVTGYGEGDEVTGYGERDEAWSRRGALYMEINDPAAAAVDLAEMVRILGTEEEGRSAGGNHEHLREARAREAEARALATSTPGPMGPHHVAAAYADCTAALEMIPGFPRAVQRMATCFLRLGYFRRATHCIESNRLECTSDSAKSMLLEIAEGKEGLDRARALLEDAEKTAEPNEAVSAAAEALQALEKARSVAPAAEYLVELEARVQLMVGNVEKARSLMEVPAVPVLGHLEELEEDDDVGTIADWRKAVEAQVVYGEGDLAQAVEMLQALTSSPSDERAMGAMATLLDCARQQLRVKKAGNLAFTMAAAKLYTRALRVAHELKIRYYLQCPKESLCICLSNRAAAHLMAAAVPGIGKAQRASMQAQAEQLFKANKWRQPSGGEDWFNPTGPGPSDHANGYSSGASGFSSGANGFNSGAFSTRISEFWNAASNQNFPHRNHENAASKPQKRLTVADDSADFCAEIRLKCADGVYLADDICHMYLIINFETMHLCLKSMTA
eukprot:gene7015-8366_t